MTGMNLFFFQSLVAISKNDHQIQFRRTVTNSVSGSDVSFALMCAGIGSFRLYSKYYGSPSFIYTVHNSRCIIHNDDCEQSEFYVAKKRGNYINLNGSRTHSANENVLQYNPSFKFTFLTFEIPERINTDTI